MLFHWTFWHVLLDCECEYTSTSVPKYTPAVDILSCDEILKLYADLEPEMPKCK